MLQASLGHVSSAPEVDCLAFAGQTRAAGVRSFRLSTSTAFLLPQVSTAPLFAEEAKAAGVRSFRLGTFLPILLSFTVIFLSFTDHCLLFRRLQAWDRQRLVLILAVSISAKQWPVGLRLQLVFHRPCWPMASKPVLVLLGHCLRLGKLQAQNRPRLIHACCLPFLPGSRQRAWPAARALLAVLPLDFCA